MVETKIKRADVIYNQMLKADSSVISQTSVDIMNHIQGKEVAAQILGVASTLLCLLDQYALDHTDVLSEAHNMVFSGEDNNMLPAFKAIAQFTKEKWELN